MVIEGKITLAEAKRKGLGEEAVAYAERYAHSAEVRMGELLRKTKRAKGGKPYQKKSTAHTTGAVEATLEELGISDNESADAQDLASLPKPDREAFIDGKITLTEAKRRAKRQKAHAKVGEVKPVEAGARFHPSVA